jgi:hypothetical protein
MVETRAFWANDVRDLQGECSNLAPILLIYISAVQRFYILGRIWLMAMEAGAPCGDWNNNNNNNNSNINKNNILFFITVFPEIFWSSHEIIFICKQEIACEGELSEVRFMTPWQ